MRAVTKQAVKEARLKEIKQELLNSEKLKVRDSQEELSQCWWKLLLNDSALTQTYFEDNPRDLQLLRHDKDLHPAVIKPHMKNVPDYLSKNQARWILKTLCTTLTVWLSKD